MLLHRPLTALTLALLGATLTLPAQAAQDATGDDGRQILLKDDGSWEYKNNDRFATAADGTRVRLKDDGSWAFIGNAPTVTEASHRTEALDIALEQVTTETRKTRNPGAKSSRVAAETVFSLTVKLSGYSQDSITPDVSNLSQFRVVDDHGTEYTIVGVTPAGTTLVPGQSYTYEVRASGAPQYTFALRVKTLTLHIDRAVFATANDVVLVMDTDNLVEKHL
jgi:hypothetical protein